MNPPPTLYADVKIIRIAAALEIAGRLGKR